MWPINTTRWRVPKMPNHLLKCWPLKMRGLAIVLNRFIYGSCYCLLNNYNKERHFESLQSDIRKNTKVCRWKFKSRHVISKKKCFHKHKCISIFFLRFQLILRYCLAATKIDGLTIHLLCRQHPQVFVQFPLSKVK